MNAVPARSQSESADLQAAFHAFNRVSDDLVRSYRDLEQRFAELDARFAAAQAVSHRLEQLLAALPSAVLVIDKSGRVVECNSAAVELLGDPLLGQSWPEIESRCFRVPLNPGENAYLHDGRILEVGLRQMGPAAGIIVLSDVTETTRLRENAAHQERLSAMGRVAATLAHQLRTPLAAMTLYGSRLAAPAIPDDERLKVAGRVQERLNYMASLINDMLLFSRGGERTQNCFAIAPLLQEFCEQAQTALAGRDVGLVCDLPAIEGFLHGSRDALLGALANLVDNALGAGAYEIRLSATEMMGDLLIRIEDDGRGIDETVRPHIFEPFYTTRSNGNGLGLAVVQSVVSAMRGCVQCTPRKPQGTCFTLLLPRADATARCASPEGEESGE